MRTIESVFKDAFDAVSELKSFGVAPKAYANIVEGEMPRLWLHNITTLDTVTYGTQTREYNVLLDLHTYHDFDGTFTEMSDKMGVLDAIWVKVLDRICQDSRLAEFPTNIRREEHFNVFDHNLMGYAIGMTVKLKEGLAYACETVQTSYYNQGYIADGYFVKE